VAVTDSLVGWLEDLDEQKGEFVMGLSANEFRRLAVNCAREAELCQDADSKQMLLDIARLYKQTAVHIEARETFARNRPETVRM